MNETDQIRRLAAEDLNLVVVFQALLRHRHVTRAAESLHVSQSAVSHALARLRRSFDDELFVKVPRGVVPTPRAEQLAEPINRVMKLLDEVFHGQLEFDPSTNERLYRIETTDLIEVILGPWLLRLQNELAPTAQFSFTDVGFELPKDRLEAGETDLAIAGFFGQLPDGYFQQSLYRDEFLTCLQAKPGRRKTKKLTLSQYCERPHILVAPRGELVGHVDRALKRQRKSRHVVLGASSFLTGGFAAAQSDAVVTAPGALVRMLANYLPLEIVDAPIKLPSIHVVQVWHGRFHQDPAHRWLREQVHACFTPYR